MRLAAKLSGALFVGVGLILLVQSGFFVKRIVELHDEEARDDLEILAGALAAGATSVWMRSGEDAARSFVARAAKQRAHTEIRILGQENAAAEVPPGVVEVHALRDRDVPVLEARTTIYTPEPVASLRLTRSRPKRDEYRARAARAQLATASAIALLFAIVALGLGYLWIGRPLELLRAQARSIAHSDFSRRNDLEQRDEIGSLAMDLNQMSDRLQEAQRLLRKERASRTAALEKLRHADRLSTIGRLASSVAHELGTPLNVVGGRAVMIHETDGLPAEVLEHATSIKSESDRMADIIRNILDFARPKALEKREAHLVDLLDEGASLIEPIAEERHVNIVVDGDRKASVEVEPRKILQVLTNLMMNGIDAMPDGGQLRLTAVPAAVRGSGSATTPQGTYAGFSIRDQGRGIGEDRLKTIFTPFYTTKGEGRGTGLGLGICQGIVREHGGWMEVESEVGQGTCFHVFLPVESDS